MEMVRRTARKMTGQMKITGVLKKYILNNTRVVQMRPRTLKEIIVNNGKYAKKFMHDKNGNYEHLCTCGKNEHFAGRLDELFPELTGIRADSIPEQEINNEALISSIINFTNSLRIWKRGVGLYSTNKKILKKEGVITKKDFKYWMSKGRGITKEEPLQLAVANLKHVGGASRLFKLKQSLNYNERDEQPNGNLEKAEISQKKLKEIINAVKGMVVSILDKGGQSIWVECPTKHMTSGFRKFVLGEKNFVAFESEEKAKDHIRDIYYACGLNELRDYREGKIPAMRLAPKFKSPLLKYRLVTSYYGFPMRTLLRCAGRALRFMLKEIHDKKLMKSFTLFKLTDVRKRLLNLRSHKDKRVSKHTRQT